MNGKDDKQDEKKNSNKNNNDNNNNNNTNPSIKHFCNHKLKACECVCVFVLCVSHIFIQVENFWN